MRSATPSAIVDRVRVADARPALGRCGLAVAAATLAASACTIGDSPASRASITVAEAPAVADGVSGIEVAVSGDADTRITLVVDGDGAGFADADADHGIVTEKSVYLLDDGKATAEVVSTGPGTVLVAVKGERTRTTRTVEFVPIRLAAGSPRPTEYAPGLTVHDVCFAVNSAVGFIMASRLEGLGTFPADGKPVVAERPNNADCPSAAVDDIGWHGWVEFPWGSANGLGTVTLDYFSEELASDGDGVAIDAGADDLDAGFEFLPAVAPLASVRLDLFGVAFPGYVVEAGDPELDTYLSVDLDLNYVNVGPLGGGPAGGVRLGDIHTVPDLEFAGSSSSNDIDAVKTGSDGHATLFFDYADADPGSYALFLTPEGGATVHVTDLVIEEL